MLSNDGFVETILTDIWNTTDRIEVITNQNTTITIVLFGLLLILGIVIIINQIRIRKQLRRIQEQLEQKEETRH